MSIRQKILIGLFLLVLGINILIGCGGGCGGNDIVAQPRTTAPVIMTQPASQTIAVGQTAIFSVTATGTSPLAYQWKKNSTVIIGATAASYTTPVATLSDNGDTFTVVVTNGAGSATSNPATLTVSVANLASQITQYGITWTFDKAYPTGQFVNGDYWVVGPVSITGISPATAEVSGRTINGSMVNPMGGTFNQGYDSAAHSYESSMNKAIGVSPSTPLVLPAGSSLISTVSLDLVTAASEKTYLQDGAILTVLSSSPPSGSFRPPYAGTDKTIRFNKSSLDYTLLASLAPVAGTPDLSTVERLFERPWIDHVADWLSGYVHPLNNLESYGRELARDVGIGALTLHLNYTDAQKEKLLIRYVQVGIDNYGVILNSGRTNWINNGGCSGGRKWPILFAGLMLNDTSMKNIGQKSGDYLYTYNYPTYGPGNVPPDYIHFQEDDQTFYVTAKDVALSTIETILNGITYYGHYYPNDEIDYPEYGSVNIGLAEWGIRHATNPLLDGNIWSAARYRQVTAVSWAGFVLAARIMAAGASAKLLWNHNALFDYQDRYMAVSATSSLAPVWRTSVSGMEAIWGMEPGWRQNSNFVVNMWDEYRDNY